MRIEQLQYSVKVAQCQSMSLAAKELFIAQPSLSASIQSLENELNFQIFKRSSQGCSLTDRGEIFIEEAKKICEHFEKIQQIPYKEDFDKNFRIAAVPAACDAIITDLIISITQRHENIKINVIETHHDKILNTLIDGKVDVVIGSYINSQKDKIYDEAKNYGITIHPVYTDILFCFIGHNHPKAKKQTISTTELGQFPQVLFYDLALVESLNSPLSENNMSNNYFLSDKSCIKKLLSSCKAYALLPYSMGYRDIYIESKRIKMIPLSNVNTEIIYYVAYKKQNATKMEIDNFIFSVSSLYKELEQKKQDALHLIEI